MPTTTDQVCPTLFVGWQQAAGSREISPHRAGRRARPHGQPEREVLRRIGTLSVFAIHAADAHLSARAVGHGKANSVVLDPHRGSAIDRAVLQHDRKWRAGIATGARPVILAHFGLDWRGRRRRRLDRRLLEGCHDDVQPRWISFAIVSRVSVIGAIVVPITIPSQIHTFTKIAGSP